MSFCVKCGNQLKDDEMFCGNCGQPVEGNVGGSIAIAKPSIDVKKALINYFKYPVSTIKDLAFSLDIKFTIIICAVAALLTAYVPFKPIKSAASLVTSGLEMFGNKAGSGIKSQVNSLYFTFLLYAILFFAVGAALILVYGAIRGRKESLISTLNIFVLSSIPAVLAMLLSVLIFGLTSFSIILIIFGFALSGILLYSQFKEALTLLEMDSFIALVVVTALSYGITFYVAFSSIKSKLNLLENLF